MARTGRETWPWSDRKIGIYHKYDQSMQSSTWIILRPTAGASRFPELFANRAKSSVLAPHLVLFHLAAQAWTEYLRYLESEVRKISRNARMDASTERRGQALDASIAFSNVQRLQYQCELIHDAKSTLRSTIKVLHGLKMLRKNISQFWFPYDKSWRHLSRADDRLKVGVSRLSTCLKWAEDMLDQAKQVSNLTSLLLSYRQTQAITANTTRMEQMANASQQDERLLLELTWATKRDSMVMKITTVITMVYLPGTFAATLFSTGFVNLYLTTPGANSHRANSIQLYVYLAMTGGLMVITILASWTWHRQARFREDAELKRLKSQQTFMSESEQNSCGAIVTTQ
jgi:hypothetical protein